MVLNFGVNQVHHLLGTIDTCFIPVQSRQSSNFRFYFLLQRVSDKNMDFEREAFRLTFWVFGGI